jgi:hypothetical protein
MDATALLVIDVQKVMFEYELYQPERVLDGITSLISHARHTGRPVVFVQHNDEGIRGGSEGWQRHVLRHRIIYQNSVRISTACRHLRAAEVTVGLRQLNVEQVGDVMPD